jgi:hypothetical protein
MCARGMQQLETVKHFFWFLQERESIRLKKARGEPYPWTTDPILQKFKFTNVKREHDRTTALLIKEFYDPHFNAPREQILLNCAIARYFGTIEFMRAVGWQETFNPDYLISVAAQRKQTGERVFTGAYMVLAGKVKGVPKHESVVREFLADLWKHREILCYGFDQWRLFHELLTEVHGFGGSGFMAKELMLDTRLTSFWPKPPVDRNFWTPVGPGSMRGAARILGYTDKRKLSPEQTRDVCLDLFSIRHKFLPRDFVKLELTDIQFQLCEHDKHQRVLLGQGRPRSLYKVEQQGTLL